MDLHEQHPALFRGLAFLYEKGHEKKALSCTEVKFTFQNLRILVNPPESDGLLQSVF